MAQIMFLLRGYTNYKRKVNYLGHSKRCPYISLCLCTFVLGFSISVFSSVVATRYCFPLGTGYFLLGTTF